MDGRRAALLLIICGLGVSRAHPARNHLKLTWRCTVIGSTADGHPFVGQLPGKPNHFILAGYNGAGMPLVFLTAKGIAKMIREDVPFEQSGVPRIFKVTEERLRKDVEP